MWLKTTSFLRKRNSGIGCRPVFRWSEESPVDPQPPPRRPPSTQGRAAMRCQGFCVSSKIDLHRAEPQFKDGSVYRQNRPTKNGRPFLTRDPVGQYTGLRFADQATRRLTVLDNAASLQDLAGLPSNRLEALSGARAGQYSIRINRQWRTCFHWEVDGPYDVEVVDYHR